MQQQIDYFTKLYELYGDSFLSLDWSAEETQELRFKEVAKIFNFYDNFTILDFGCGLGHFYEYLKNTKLLEEKKISYTGYDITPVFIQKCHDKYPNVEFVDQLPERTWDFIVACGVFNVKNPYKTEKDFLPIVSYLYFSSKIGVAVNFQSNMAMVLVQGEQKIKAQQTYLFYNELKTTALLYSTFKKINITDNYLPNDFTAFIFK